MRWNIWSLGSPDAEASNDRETGFHLIGPRCANDLLSWSERLEPWSPCEQFGALPDPSRGLALKATIKEYNLRFEIRTSVFP